MVDGGQQITSVDTHLQKGSDLFDTDPKGALSAYYQAVSLEPSHIEGWNQIGRLMFDLQQYSEAEMIFKRVEQLATEQGLADWAEMAVQNIELTRQIIAERAALEPVPDQSVPDQPVVEEPVQDVRVQSEPVPQQTLPPADIIPPVDVAPPVPIEAINNFAAVGELPAVTMDSGSVPLQQVQAPVMGAVATPVEPTVEAPIPLQEVPYQEVTPLNEVVAANPTPIENIPLEPASAELARLDPVTENSGQPTVAPESIVPVGMPGQLVPMAPPAPSQILAERLAGGGLPDVAKAAIQAANQPQPQGQVQAPPLVPVAAVGQPQPQPQLPPPVPFAQQAPAMPMPAPTSPAQPLPVSPPVDVEMEPPRTSSSKIALMITGVVGAVGIGIGAAQYLNTSDQPASSIPVVKSEDKLMAKPAVKAVAAIDKTNIPTPDNAGRDQAYKIGMTHLVKGEFSEARSYLEQAEARGHEEAGYNLASLYAKGDGVEQNFEKAVFYLKKSADRGYYPAMTNLGLLYAQGQGVEQNYLTARSLWLKAAAGEHPDAMHNLAVIYATGKGVERDMDEAVKWYRKGANAGYIDSIANLGLIYANGDGVERDFDEAKRLWETAAGKGHKIAAQNLEKLKQVMEQQKQQPQTEPTQEQQPQQ